jgi:hypothetical protein
MTCAVPRSARVTLTALTLVTGACGPIAAPQPEECTEPSALVSPDTIIQGERAGDILEPYFGLREGSITWSDGEEAALTLDVLYQSGELYQLSNVWRCEARNIGYDTKARVSTSDGSLNHEVSVIVFGSFPNAPEGAAPKTVLSFSGLPQRDFGAALTTRLSVDASRYDEPYLLFDAE